MAVLCLSACGTETLREEEPAIRVGKRGVTLAELKRDIQWLVSDLEAPSHEWKEARDRLLERVIDHYRVLEYGLERGIALSEAELQAAVREIRQDYADSDFQQVLLKKALDFEDWKRGLREHLLLRKIVASVAGGVPPVTHEEITAYFEAHAGEFRHPPMVRARQVVVRTRSEAQAVLKRLQGGEKMEDLAGALSISPEGKRQGDLGWVARGQMHESMEKAVFALSPGQTSPVVETPYGFHIFQVLSKKPQGQKGLPEVRAVIEDRLLSQKEEEFLGQWLEALRIQYPVQVDRQLVDKLEWG